MNTNSTSSGEFEYQKLDTGLTVETVSADRCGGCDGCSWCSHHV